MVIKVSTRVRIIRIPKELVMKLSFGKACRPREDGYESGEKSLFSINIGNNY